MVPSEYPVVASELPVLNELSGVKNIAPMTFFVASEFPVLIEISFKVLRILAITFYSELQFG